jgi:hypothetical protein
MRSLVLTSELPDLLREVLAMEGHLELTATGDSMRPAVMAGDSLIIGPLRPGEPRLGQLVAWSAKDRVIVHRVIDLEGSGFTSAGDACPGPDPRLSRSHLIGVVRRVKRRRWPRLRARLRTYWERVAR